MKTPGGKLRYLHIKKKGTAPKCGDCGTKLPGVSLKCFCTLWMGISGWRRGFERTMAEQMGNGVAKNTNAISELGISDSGNY